MVGNVRGWQAKDEGRWMMDEGREKREDGRGTTEEGRWVMDDRRGGEGRWKRGDGRIIEDKKLRRLEVMWLGRGAKNR